MSTQKTSTKQENQYIFLINGPITAGKTSLIKAFLENEPRLFRIAYDVIKRQISDFDGEKDRDLVRELLRVLSKSAIRQGLSIITESVSASPNVRELYIKLAEKHGMAFYEVNVEAPYDVLEERLKNRVQAGNAFTVKTPEQLATRYDVYVQNRNKDLPTYDTSKHSPEEIYAMIKEDLF